MVNTTPRGTSLFAWIVVFTILSTLFLVARAVSARLVRRGFYADDALVTFAYVCAEILGVHQGDSKLTNFILETGVHIFPSRCCNLGHLYWRYGQICHRYQFP